MTTPEPVERAEQVLPPSPERAPRGEPLEPLDLVDTAGVRMRATIAHASAPGSAAGSAVLLGVYDGSEVAIIELAPAQLAQLVAWALKVPGVASGALMLRPRGGRPYTDEELARGPLTDQAKRFITGNLEGDRG
jgi:hypothetical protein